MVSIALIVIFDALSRKENIIEPVSVESLENGSDNMCVDCEVRLLKLEGNAFVCEFCEFQESF